MHACNSGSFGMRLHSTRIVSHWITGSSATASRVRPSPSAPPVNPFHAYSFLGSRRRPLLRPSTSCTGSLWIRRFPNHRPTLFWRAHPFTPQLLAGLSPTGRPTPEVGVHYPSHAAGQKRTPRHFKTMPIMSRDAALRLHGFASSRGADLGQLAPICPQPA